MLQMKIAVKEEDPVREFQRIFTRLKQAIGRVIVGQSDVIDQVLICFLARGHVLLEGVPGLGKTLLVKSLSRVLGFDFKRIQFTPDLMPADIIGTQLVMEDKGGNKRFKFSPGPLFTNIVLADEINRATPRTQSALLEAMEERQVTVGRESKPLQQPFFVLATQNPIEMEGTYPLPEAQVDRFLLKIFIDYPTDEELPEILRRTTEGEECSLKPVFPPDSAWAVVDKMQRLVREVLISKPVMGYVIALVGATRPAGRRNQAGESSLVNKYVNYGSSPRGAQAIVLAAKVVALLNGRVNVSYRDVEQVLFPALNHRLLLNFEAEADRVTCRDILIEIMNRVRRAGRGEPVGAS